MVTEQDLLSLLYRPESEVLDFKGRSYNLSEDSGKADLLKDVICMANTPREQTSHIVLGVAKHPDGTFDLPGLDKIDDEELLQSQFAERVYPIPSLTYEIVPHSGKHFGVIMIPVRRVGPCVSIKDFPGGGNVLRQRQVYFRRGTKNDVAMPEDLQRIVSWIMEPRVQHPPTYSPTTPACGMCQAL